MANQAERLHNAGKFQEAIFDYAKIQSQQILEELRQKQLEELKAARKAIRKETEDSVRRRLEQAKSEVAREIAQREQELKREILKTRQDIIDAVFAEAKAKLLDFAASDAYLPFLMAQVDKVKAMFDVADVVFILRKADEKYQPEIEKAFGRPCTFQTDSNLQIGGLQTKSATLGKMADQSLDALLQDQEVWFENHSGLSVI